MDRVLEAPVSRRSSSREELRLLYPGEKEWELWHLCRGKNPVRQSVIPPAELAAKLKTSASLAIPIQHLLVLPLWLGTTDNSLMKEMVALHLEGQNLGQAGFDYIAVRREKDRTLLAVSLLNENFPSELCLPAITGFRPATDYWSLPQSQLVFWKELGALAVVITSGSEPIYLQGSFGEKLHPSLVFEAHCAKILLENEGSFTMLLGITLVGDFSAEEIDFLRFMQLPIRQIERMAPAYPAHPRTLLPATARLLQKQRRQTRSRKKIWAAGLALYLLLLGILFSQLAWLSWQKSALEQDLGSHRGEVEMIRNISARWQSLEPVLLPENYAVEILFRCSRWLPEDGVRFVSYDQNPSRVFISGEARNAQAAFLYVEALKRDPELDAFEWTMAPPALLANESAQFRIEGKRRNANP